MTPATAAIEEGLVEIDSLKIGYAKYGHGPEALLFIPGAVGCYTKDFPEPVLNAFDDSKFTIIVIDPPGYGKSRPPDRKQSVNRCMLDSNFCLKLMKELQLTPFTVVGWSEGGRTAIHVTNNGKDNVNGLVLFGASSRVDARGSRVFQSMRNTDQWMPEAKKPYLDYYDEDYFRKQWADICDMIVQVYEMGGRFPSDYCLKKIEQPVMILHGGMDRFCLDPKYFKENLKNGARIEVHARGKHDVHIQYPGWFAQNVTSFVEEISRNKG